MPTIVVIGHSHSSAIVDAAKARERRGALRPDHPLRFVLAAWSRDDPGAFVSRDPSSPGGTFNPALLDDFRSVITDTALVFVTFGGATHNGIGLCNYPPPYDFVLDDEPDGTDLSKKIVPASLIEYLIRRYARPYLDATIALRALTDRPICHIESPPPIRSENHIRRHAGGFRERVDQYGVAPPALRRKLWRLHSRIFRQTCAGAGIDFLPAPAASMDADGFLLKEGWARDPTHGNSWYGEHVVRQIHDYVDQKLAQREPPQ